MTADGSELLERFSVGVRAFLDRAGKAQHASNVFDLRRRTLIGCYAYLEHLPWVVDLLGTRTTPAELGARGRGLCGSPFGPQIHGLLWGYLLARENELGFGRQGGSDEDLERLLLWWEGMAAAYRADGWLLPEEADDTQPAAAPEGVAALLAEHGKPVAELPELGRLTTALQLYNYVLRGEQRGTTYYHGPYPGPDGQTLVVEEFTRLRRNELSWNPDPPPLAFDSVAVILAVEGVAFEFDLFAGLRTNPSDYRPHVVAAAILTCDDGSPEPLADDAIAELAAASLTAQGSLFRSIIQWPADFKVAYGNYHYLDFLAPFLDAAGADESELDRLREAFAQTREDRLAWLIESERMPVWERMFARRQPVFSPLRAVRSGLAANRW